MAFDIFAIICTFLHRLGPNTRAGGGVLKFGGHLKTFGNFLAPKSKFTKSDPIMPIWHEMRRVIAQNERYGVLFSEILGFLSSSYQLGVTAPEKPKNFDA